MISTFLSGEVIYMAFQKGQSGNLAGRPPGAKQRITVTLEHWFERAIEHISDVNDNPLVVMADIMSDPNQSARMRLQASVELAKYIVPTLPKTAELTINTFNTDLTQEELMKQLEENRQALLAFQLKDVVSEQ